MKRALTVDNILMKKRNYIPWGNPKFQEAFGKPEACGVWFIWANSGNGKSSLVMELIKAMSPVGRVVMNALEEADSDSMRKKLVEHRMSDLKKKLLFVNESMEELELRLDRKKSAKIVVIDSVQYTHMSYKEYVRFKEKYATTKILIFTSHADGKKPTGRVANSIMYDAYMKVWVEGYRAFCKGREIGENGGIYTIWNEGAERYWGEELTTKN